MVVGVLGLFEKVGVFFIFCVCMPYTIISTVSDAGFHLKGAEIRVDSSRCNPASAGLLKGTCRDRMCNVTLLVNDLSGHVSAGCRHRLLRQT